MQTVSVGRVSDATYSLLLVLLAIKKPRVKACRYYQMLVWPEDLQSPKASLESPEAYHVLWFFCPKVSPEISSILP